MTPHRKYIAIGVVLLTALLAIPSAQARGGAGSVGDVCGTHVTVQLQARQMKDKVRTRGKGFSLYALRIYNGQPGIGPYQTTFAIELQPGYQLCSLRTSNTPDYVLWPYTSGFQGSLATPSATVKFTVGKVVHPRGSNCGSDALRVVRHPGGQLAGAKSRIHVSRSSGSWSWKGSGLAFCSQREISRTGKVLWHGRVTAAGRHPTASSSDWLEVTARVK